MARNFKFWNQRKQTSRSGNRGVTPSRWRRSAVRTTMLGIETLEDRRLLAAGDLDTTFNPLGSIPGIKIGQFAPFGAGSDGDEGVVTAVQADGRIVVATQQYLAGFNVNFDVLVSRYNADGSADTTFGSGGSVSFDFTSGQSLVRDIAIDSAGRIIVVGSAPVGATSGFAGARLTSAGVLDSTFGVGGKVTNNFGGQQSQALAVAVQADGKIVVAGEGNLINPNFAVVRYDRNGDLDTSFAIGGRLQVDFAGLEDRAENVALQSDGKIVAGGLATARAASYGVIRATP
jgi:uncharacterized delta-60 repeat protein